MKHIDVCICTYKRPKLLRKLLNALELQETENLFSYSIVVADNDCNETAALTVAEFSNQSKLIVAYCVESQKNIALARNLAIAHASGDYIAFIDDDEYPVTNWLYSLFVTCESISAAGVLGPVLPCFEITPPRWAVKGRFFDRPTHNTGYKIDLLEARTGNVIFRRKILDGEKKAFRIEFGSGGEDIDLFRRLMKKGHHFIWCQEAVAYETVPQSRCNRKYLIKRALLRGTNTFKHRTSRTSNVLKSFFAIPIYSIVLPCLLIIGDYHFLTYLIKLCDHAGRIMAVFNWHPVKERDR